MTLKFAQRTDIGYGRITNQDRLFAKTESIFGKKCGLFCVADGMGGLSDGHYAASIAMKVVEQWWYEYLPSLYKDSTPDHPVICHKLFQLFLNINKFILSHAQAQNTSMGTTCSLLFVCNGLYYIAHSGDSRIYLIQKQLFFGNKFLLLMEEHSIRAELQKQGMTSKEINNHSNNNCITSCLGIVENPKIFTCAEKLAGHGTFILCSDGLYNVINDKELEQVALSHRQCEHLAHSLIETALERKTRDNASVIVVTF